MTEKPIVLTHHETHKSRFSKKKDRRPPGDVNPLRRKPDYRDQRHKGSFESKSHTAAISTQRIYFVDENLNKLQPTAEGVHTGEKPARFKGILNYLPLVGQKLKAKDDLFIVKDVIHEFRLSLNAPPKIFIVLAPFK